MIETVQGPSLASQPVALAEAVLFYLLGKPSLSPTLADHLHVVRASPLMSPSRSELRDRALARL
ncbi:MAG: hypothetical protein AAF907_04710, partial [Planctomycetota bacterium]